MLIRNHLYVYILLLLYGTVTGQPLDSLYAAADQANNESRFIESNRSFEKMLDPLLRDGNLDKLALVYTRMGINYWQLGDYQEALNYHSKALQINEERDSERHIAIDLNNIGLVHWQLKEYDLALESYEESVRKAKQLKYDTLLGNNYNNIGIIYKEKEQYDTAEYYHRLAFDIFKRLGIQHSLANSYNNIGVLFKLQEDLDSAEYYFDYSLHLRKEIGDKEGIATSLNNLSEVYADQGRVKEAIASARESLKISRHISSKLRISEALSNLSDIYEVQGVHDSALYFYKQYHQVSDSIFSKEKADNMGYLQAKLETRLKDLKIDNLHKERKLSRLRLYYFLALGGVFLTILGIFIQRKLLNYRKDKRVAEVELENAQKILSVKQKELRNYLFTITRKNQFIQSLQRQLEDIHPTETNDQAKELLRQKILTEEDWKEYQKRFTEIYPGFFSSLKLSPISFTKAEMRLLALIKLNLSGREMADILGISHQSVRVSKLRLRKKLIANGIESIEKFLSFHN